MVEFTIEKSSANFSPVANVTDNFKANFTENFIDVLHMPGMATTFRLS